MWCRAGKIRRGEVNVEVYGRDRFIVLGDRVAQTPLQLAELPAAAETVATLI